MHSGYIWLMLLVFKDFFCAAKYHCNFFHRLKILTSTFIIEIEEDLRSKYKKSKENLLYLEKIAKLQNIFIFVSTSLFKRYCMFCNQSIVEPINDYF